MSTRRLFIWFLIAVALVGGGIAFTSCGKPVEAQTVSHRLYFTWPGDDGMEGVASGIEVRADRRAIAAGDTLGWWNAAIVIQRTPPPLPKAAGTRDSIEVLGLASETQYTAVARAYDEVPNWSGFSNATTFVTRDWVPPDPPQNLSSTP